MDKGRQGGRVVRWGGGGTHIHTQPTVMSMALGRETGTPESVSVVEVASLTAYMVSAVRAVSWPNLQQGGVAWNARREAERRGKKDGLQARI